MFTSESPTTTAWRPWRVRLDASQTRRLHDVLTHAATTVPFYVQLGAASGGELGPEQFPLIGKKQFVDRLDALLSLRYADYARVHELAEAGPRSLVCEFTSGSSGYPMRCYKTLAERTQLALSLHRKRTSVYREFSLDRMFGFIHNTTFESRTYGDSLGNLSEPNIERVLKHLRDVVRPAVLHGNTMVFIYYADFIRKHGFDLGSWRVRFIESVSESLSDEQRAYIEEVFDTTVYNCYGCLECYNVAYDCSLHRLHLNENVVVEIVDPITGEDLTETGREGEVVLTSLVNRAQPIIRYKTGDIGRLSRSACDCGSRAPVVHLTGRRKIDYIKLLYTTADPALTICGYDIFATAMYRLVTGGHDYVSWYNVIQTELNAFEVLYSRKRTFSDAFFTLFQQYAEEELGMPARLAFIEKDEREVLLINKKNRVFRSLLQND